MPGTYAIWGCTPVTRQLLVREKRVNAIAAPTSIGIVAVDLVTGSIAGHAFFKFLRGTLIPRLMPFNGTNPNSVLIVNNCSIHHMAEVKDMLHQAGILVSFLPPLKKHDVLLQCGAPLLTINFN